MLVVPSSPCIRCTKLSNSGIYRWCCWRMCLFNMAYISKRWSWKPRRLGNLDDRGLCWSQPRDLVCNLSNRRWSLQLDNIGYSCLDMQRTTKKSCSSTAHCCNWYIPSSQNWNIGWQGKMFYISWLWRQYRCHSSTCCTVQSHWSRLTDSPCNSDCK